MLIDLLLSLLLPQGIQQKWERLMRELGSSYYITCTQNLAKFKVKLGIDIKS